MAMFNSYVSLPGRVNYPHLPRVSPGRQWPSQAFATVLVKGLQRTLLQDFIGAAFEDMSCGGEIWENRGIIIDNDDPMTVSGYH